MRRGDIVKYSRPVSTEEAKFRFILLSQLEKGRVDIQLICDDRIKPIETVEGGEVEPAPEERHRRHICMRDRLSKER